MLCSSQSKNTWGLIFCQQNLAQRCSHTGNRQKLHSQRGRQAVFAGLEAELLLLMAGWLYCGIERHKEKTPGSRPQAVWHSTRNVSAAQLFQVQLAELGRVSPFLPAPCSCCVQHELQLEPLAAVNVGSFLCLQQGWHWCLWYPKWVCGCQGSDFRLRIAGLLYTATLTQR